jgi:hypothetical protein
LTDFEAFGPGRAEKFAQVRTLIDELGIDDLDLQLMSVAGRNSRQRHPADHRGMPPRLLLKSPEITTR